MVIIFRGVTGSGKSTLADVLLGKSLVWDEHPESIQKDCEWAQYILRLRMETKDLPKQAFSADYFFTNAEGVYNFNVKYLSHAHNQCLQKFTEAVRDGLPLGPKPGLLIVDNTNCSIQEVAPYVATAQAYGHDLKIITLLHDVRDCAKRGVHGAPARSVLRQHYVLEESLKNWPHWWPQEIFFT